VTLLARLWRWAVDWLTGRRWTVPQPDTRTVAQVWGRNFIANVWPHLAARERDNRTLLTGMVAALLAGPPFGPPHRRSTRPRSAGKLVGWPMVYRFPGGRKLGITEWDPAHISRQDHLEARRNKKGRAT